MSFGGVDVEGYSTYYNDDVDGGGYTTFKSQKYKRQKPGRKSLRRGLLSVFDTGKVKYVIQTFFVRNIYIWKLYTKYTSIVGT